MPTRFKDFAIRFMKDERGILGGLLSAGLGFLGGERERRDIRRGNEQSQQFLREGRDFALNDSGLTGFRDRGQAADQTFFDALGVGGDPAAADAAFARFQDSTGFRSQLQAGQDAIGAGAAAAGKFNSGATGRALVSFGQDLGRRTFQDFLGNLNTGANRGFGASTNLANVATGTAGNAAGIAAQSAQARAAAGRRGFDAASAGLGAAAGSARDIFGTDNPGPQSFFDLF